LAKQVSFDEMPCVGAKLDELSTSALIKIDPPSAQYNFSPPCFTALPRAKDGYNRVKFKGYLF